MNISKSDFFQTNAANIINYFYSIKQNPDAYSFSTHKGIKLINGSLDQVGSQFETTEQFLFFFMTLRFEITKINDDKFFTFRLIHPFKSLNIVGKFSYEPIDENITLLTLSIKSKPQGFIAHFQKLLLFFPPVRWFIEAQVGRELKFIKKNVETANL